MEIKKKIISPTMNHILLRIEISDAVDIGFPSETMNKARAPSLIPIPPGAIMDRIPTQILNGNRKIIANWLCIDIPSEFMNRYIPTPQNNQNKIEVRIIISIELLRKGSITIFFFNCADTILVRNLKNVLDCRIITEIKIKKTDPNFQYDGISFIWKIKNNPAIKPLININIWNNNTL